MKSANVIKRKLNSIISLMIIFVMLFCTVAAKAESGELIKNGGFENSTDGFLFDGVHKWKITDETCAEGKYSCKITNRNLYNESVKYNLTDILKQSGYYKFEVYIKLSEEAFDYSKMQGVITVITDEDEYKFKTETVNAVNEKFTLCTGEAYIKWNGNIKSAVFGVENCISSELCDFFVDGFSLEFIGEHFEKTEEKSDRFLVGALRYDNISDSDINTLAFGLKKQSLPYWFDFAKNAFANYASVVATDKIYAEYAGIDYFAYRPEDGTYVYHGGGNIKMCFAVGKDTDINSINSLGSWFKSENYQKYNGKNLVIFTSDFDFVRKAEAVKKVNASVGQDTVIMLISSNPAAVGQADIIALGAEKGTDFTEAVKFEKKVWDGSSVPYITTYVTGKNGSEILSHISYGTSVAENGMNAVIFDWNNCKESSYTVPTVKCSAGGIFAEENGNYLLNTEIADGLHTLFSGKDTEILRKINTGKVLSGIQSGSEVNSGNSNGNNGSSNNISTAIPNTAIEPSKNPSEGIINSSDTGENIGFADTADNYSAQNGGHTSLSGEGSGVSASGQYTNRNLIRNIVIASAVTAVFLGGATTYKVITEKKKNEKKD